MSGGVFFHVQHLLGIGHLRRAALIVRALRRQRLAVTLASGGEPIPDLDLGGAELLQLPPALSADASFSAILDDRGRPIDKEWRDRRQQLLLDAFANRRPDILLIEMFPFGRRAFAFELLPLMAAAKARGLPIAISLRDILVRKDKPSRIAEIVGLVKEYAGAVLVHGDPLVVRLEATFPAASEFADRIVYTGYVAETPAVESFAEGDEILVSAGGGAVGGPLLRAALAARPASRAAEAPWRLIAGPNLPEAEFAKLGRGLPAGVTLTRFRQDFQALLARSRLSISQAGYNTVMDILSVGARAIVLPFAEGIESEQTTRARLLAERGFLHLIESPAEPRRLAAAIDAALGSPRPRAGGIDLKGAETSARYLQALIRR
jgi:predicted glycosyltransferase